MHIASFPISDPRNLCRFPSHPISIHQRLYSLKCMPCIPSPFLVLPIQYMKFIHFIVQPSQSTIVLWFNADLQYMHYILYNLCTFHRLWNMHNIAWYLNQSCEGIPHFIDSQDPMTMSLILLPFYWKFYLVSRTHAVNCLVTGCFIGCAGINEGSPHVRCCTFT